MNRCTCCDRLSLRPCRRGPYCRAWAKSRAKFDSLTYESRETVYSKEAGKFVVPLFGGA